MFITCWDITYLIVTGAPWHRYNYWNRLKVVRSLSRVLWRKWAQWACGHRAQNNLGNSASSCHHISPTLSIYSSWESDSSVFILPLWGLIWGSLHFSFKDNNLLHQWRAMKHIDKIPKVPLGFQGNAPSHLIPKYVCKHEHMHISLLSTC